MKKEKRVKNKLEFNNIIKNGNNISNENYVIYYLPKKEKEIRFGVAIGTKLGNAVKRNKLKRQIKSIIREIEEKFLQDKDYIIIAKRDLKKIKYNEMKKSLINIVTRMEK